jgi:hypothetical protein
LARKPIARPAILFVLLGSTPLVWADGGTVRVHQIAGSYQIAVFTSPTPFRAGLVDISVLVQDAATGEYLPQARVTLRLTSPGTPQSLEFSATTETVTNRLFHAAVFELPHAGLWDVAVAVDGPRGPAAVRFDVVADAPTPRWVELWAWFTWPLLVIALFAVHRALARPKAKTSVAPTHVQ